MLEDETSQNLLNSDFNAGHYLGYLACSPIHLTYMKDRDLFQLIDSYIFAVS